jgi:hypothetical protein
MDIFENRGSVANRKRMSKSTKKQPPEAKK